MMMLWINGFLSLLRELYFDKGEELNISHKNFKLKRWVGMVVSLAFISVSLYFFIQLVEVGREIEKLRSELEHIILLEYEREELLLENTHLKDCVKKKCELFTP